MTKKQKENYPTPEQEPHTDGLEPAEEEMNEPEEDAIIATLQNIQDAIAALNDRVAQVEGGAEPVMPESKKKEELKGVPERPQGEDEETIDQAGSKEVPQAGKQTQTGDAPGNDRGNPDEFKDGEDEASGKVSKPADYARQADIPKKQATRGESLDEDEESQEEGLDGELDDDRGREEAAQRFGQALQKLAVGEELTHAEKQAIQQKLGAHDAPNADPVAMEADQEPGKPAPENPEPMDDKTPSTVFSKQERSVEQELRALQKELAAVKENNRAEAHKDAALHKQLTTRQSAVASAERRRVHGKDVSPEQAAQLDANAQHRESIKQTVNGVIREYLQRSGQLDKFERRLAR